MRIAFDARSVYEGMGGIGRYAASLMRELGVLDWGNRYVAYCTRQERAKSYQIPAHWTIRECDAGMIDERFDQLILPGLLEEDLVDLYFNPTFAVPLIHTRARTVAAVHDVVFRRYPNLVPPRLRTYLDRATRIARDEADRVITASEFSRNEIVALYPVEGQDIVVIPHGVDGPPVGSLASDAQVLALGLVPQEYVLYVGSLEPKKNITVLLQAFEKTLRAVRKLPLVLALAGNLAPSYPINSIVKQQGLERHVRLLGHVTDSDLEALYAHAMIFVYPSLYEGFGLPPLEAMVRGVPTVVANSSSLPEVVGQAALLFPPTSADALTEAILELIRHSDRREELRRKGLLRASEFSWRRSAERHLEAFRSVMKVA